MRLSHIASLALPAAFTLLLSLAATASAADDGFVIVRGTLGATLSIDGTVSGTLPMGEIRLPEGEHTIRATKTGYQPAKTTVYLQSLRGETVVLYLKPKSKRGAAIRNLTVPGWGSWYSDRPREGIAYLALQSLVVGYAFYENSRFESRLDDYEAALAEYESAVGPNEIAATRAARDDAWDKLSSSESNRDGAIWAAVAIQVLSAVDGWFRFPYTGLGNDPIALVPESGAGGQSSLALRIRF